MGFFDAKENAMNQDLQKLENLIGYNFEDKSLICLALTHSSYLNEHHLPKNECNERLEFLGDAVLELISSDFLFRRDLDMPEGILSKTRAALVCEQALAQSARELTLGQFLRLGKGEEQTGGRTRESITSDAVEAVIGAIYLDGGLTSAKEFIYRFILNDIEKKQLFYDSKTILQEIVQKQFSEPLSYRLISQEGPEHSKVFTTIAYIGDKPYGTGRGKSKKAAEQAAAYETILRLNNE